MCKRIVSLLLCLCMLFGICVSAFASSVKYPDPVPESARILDGIGEIIRTGFSYLNIRTMYRKCEHICSIPELDKEFVPQGYCYIESENMFAITYYSDGDENSILALIDADSGERVKTVKLCYGDGSACMAHVGGIADIGDSLLISSGKSVRRLKIADALNAADYSEVRFCGKLTTDMQASYIGSYENYLFVGQFYCYTVDGTYDTPAEQRIYTPNRKRNYAMCEKFDLTDIDKVFEEGTAEPLMVLSMPNSVQGIAYDGETFVTSSSYSLRSPSKIRYYKLTESDMMFRMRDKDVPLYFLEERNAEKTVKIPPLAEGIDWCNGKITGIFESGAKKFIFANARTPYICEFN